MTLWVEQFLRTELQPKWKETSGRYSVKDWTRRIEKCLIKCSLIRNCITPGSNACTPQLIHPILMSILLEHYKQLKKIEKSTKIV